MRCLEYPFDSAMILQKKRALRRELLAQEGLVPKKIAILSGSTVGEIKNILELFLLNAGIQPTFYVGEYARFYEEGMFDPSGALAAFKPDVIYLHTSVHNLGNLPAQTDSPEQAEQKLRAETQRWMQLWRAMQRFGCPIIQNNFELPDVRVMGSLDAVDIRGRVRFVNRMNDMTALWAEKTPGFYMHDLCWLSASEGVGRWCSPAAWCAYQYALDVPYIPVLCHSLANIVKSIFGKNKKGVVLDLDNTLWGGVIGDDGAEGVALGEESPAGRAFTAFQRYLKELSGMGVLLNVSSKNEDAAARAGFARADSVLKTEDFLCFNANWDPKPRNVEAIAKTINILPESLVFLDDNPVERDLMRQTLPGVAAPELTAPEEYVRILDRGGWFEPTAISDDDRRRSEMYRQNAQRAAEVQSFENYDDYLRSLAMRGEFGAFDAAHLERITQLINKTNQFNMTTRRYTAAEIEALCADPAYLTLYGRLADKFGDNGIVTAMIGHQQGETLEIDLWIMSCRVFKRNLEQTLFDQIVAACKARGVKTIVGRFLPTAKNLPAKDFYASIGFARVSESETETVYRFELPAQYEPLNHVMEVTDLP
ncbi:MAG: HAD-IIIC family phosphatase [Subdoligranulum sp.]|nr:HAD-IIIC family phosphatase [Subdoligranulum sp.]